MKMALPISPTQNSGGSQGEYRNASAVLPDYYISSCKFRNDDDGDNSGGGASSFNSLL